MSSHASLGGIIQSAVSSVAFGVCFAFRDDGDGNLAFAFAFAFLNQRPNIKVKYRVHSSHSTQPDQLETRPFPQHIDDAQQQ